PRMRLLCALGLFLALLHVTSCLLIGAFNIENFGVKKNRNQKTHDRSRETHIQRSDGNHHK
ncbi:hypothetical protein KUCAC02_035803, partial [Chaenocephalus aceratus]